MKLYVDQIIDRLEQLKNEVINAGFIDHRDRLRAFKEYCDRTPVIASCLLQLPKTRYNFRDGIQDLQEKWPAGDASYSYRWDAIRQEVEGYANQRSFMEAQGFTPNNFSKYFVSPLCSYLVHQLAKSGTILYLLLRYKRWVEWFESEQLYKAYESGGGESILDRNLHRFLFESGIDYPFSQPHSPGGQADIVASLETDDPLVLENKVWDSKKNYKEDRVRDGLRQVMDYAAKYGKDKGYVVVFNCDPIPLIFIDDTNPGEWPARLQVDRTYYFIDINIAQHSLPVSQQDKGKPVKRNEVSLKDLWHKVQA